MRETVRAAEHTREVDRHGPEGSGELQRAVDRGTLPLQWRPRVWIYRPARTPTQSGWAKTRHWVLEFEPLSPPTPDPLMGWIGSDDTLQQVQLRFPSKESAIGFARRQGWSYAALEPHDRRLHLKSYADNFLALPDRGPLGARRLERAGSVSGDVVEEASKESFSGERSARVDLGDQDRGTRRGSGRNVTWSGSLKRITGRVGRRQSWRRRSGSTSGPPTPASRSWRAAAPR